MIAGLPWTAWLLLVAAVGVGLAIELVFFFNQRSADQSPAAQSGPSAAQSGPPAARSDPPSAGPASTE